MVPWELGAFWLAALVQVPGIYSSMIHTRITLSFNNKCHATFIVFQTFTKNNTLVSVTVSIGFISSGSLLNAKDSSVRLEAYAGFSTRSNFVLQRNQHRIRL
jgi:hypothetical protein